MAAKCALSVLASCALVLSVPVPAAGQGLGAWASAKVNPQGAVKECLKLGPYKELRPCGLLGTRRVELTWASGCGPQVGEGDRETKVKLVAEPPSPNQWPYIDVAPDDPFADLPAAASGTFMLFPGWTVHAEATVTCRGAEPPPSTPSPVDELTEPAPGLFAPFATSAQAPTEEVTARSATLSAPPRLVARHVAFASYCARSRSQLKALKGKLQAGRTGWLGYSVRFATMDQHPTMGNPAKTGATPEDRGRIRLYATGAGIKVSGRPDRVALRTGSLELKLQPRKAGTLRIWATVDGLKTNALKLRVVPGC